jgi:hypothetical protein
MTMNLIQNLNNTLDNNLLSYGLLGGSLAIISFSTLYFANKYFFKSNDIYMEAWNNDNDNIIQQIGSKLENPNISGLDINKVPKLDTLSESLLYKVNESVQAIPDLVDSNIQTISNTTDANVQTISNTVDADVQIGNGLVTKTEVVAKYTDEGIIIPWGENVNDLVQEVLYGMCSEGTDLSDIDPVTFADEIRNNPQYSGWFNSIENWANNIKTSSGKSFNSSEFEFLTKVRALLDTKPNSPVENITVSLSRITETVGMTAEELNITYSEYLDLQYSILDAYNTLGCF